MNCSVPAAGLLALLLAGSPASLAQNTGFSWGVIVAADPTLPEAQAEGRRVQRLLGQRATLIRCNNWIRTVILVNDRREAYQLLAAAQRKLSPSSYLVDMRIWCPGRRLL
jgi:hypothetical protein